mmetsp:Transcript_22728/g.37572  ORF Transcript_22728/g.37572 Transcript_22728/m.37572 type:complete len:242 (-) Transcript_22728:1131-1856(-)
MRRSTPWRLPQEHTDPVTRRDRLHQMSRQPIRHPRQAAIAHLGALPLRQVNDRHLICGPGQGLRRHVGHGSRHDLGPARSRYCTCWPVRCLRQDASAYAPLEPPPHCAFSGAQVSSRHARLTLCISRNFAVMVSAMAGIGAQAQMAKAGALWHRKSRLISPPPPQGGLGPALPLRKGRRRSARETRLCPRPASPHIGRPRRHGSAHDGLRPLRSRRWRPASPAAGPANIHPKPPARPALRW